MKIDQMQLTQNSLLGLPKDIWYIVFDKLDTQSFTMLNHTSKEFKIATKEYIRSFCNRSNTKNAILNRELKQLLFSIMNQDIERSVKITLVINSRKNDKRVLISVCPRVDYIIINNTTIWNQNTMYDFDAYINPVVYHNCLALNHSHTLDFFDLEYDSQCGAINC